MSRMRKAPLRALTDEEQSLLRQLACSPSEPAGHVARAKILLAVNEGKRYGAAAQAAGRKSNDAISHLASRFNQEGLAALAPRHGGGAQVVYDPDARERILREVRRREGVNGGRQVRQHGLEGAPGVCNGVQEEHGNPRWVSLLHIGKRHLVRKL